MKKIRKLLAFWLRLAAFALVLAVTLAAVIYVLIPKHDYGICPITTFYTQEENTVDVLVLGTSCAYTGVNTNVLWREYGLAAYNLCTAEQPFWISYYYLEEALKTQQPKLIVLDAKAALYQEEYTARGRTIMATYGIRDLGTRLRAIEACVGAEKLLDYALVFNELHSYYASLEAENFQFPPDNGGRGPDWKGYIEMEETAWHEEPPTTMPGTKKPLHPRQEEYLIRLISLAQAHEIPVLIVAFPNPDYESDAPFYNSLVQAVKRYDNVTCVNYNDPQKRPSLDYTKDFADWQHLNVKGSVTFSRQLGKDLLKRYDLPNRREDAAYASWQRCADDWYAKYPQYIPRKER